MLESPKTWNFVPFQSIVSVSLFLRCSLDRENMLPSDFYQGMTRLRDGRGRMKSNLLLFVSSTMELQEERNAVSEVINQFEGVPVKMELFTARSESPEEVCLTELSRCDVYICIFGDRYAQVQLNLEGQVI